MILGGGKLGNTRILSRKTIELMSHDQLGKIAPDMGFGIGFGISGAKAPLDELSSVGALGWGGFFYTTFSIDPKEDMIIVFMAQLHPTGGLTLDHEVQVLAEQSIND
jgi:CubicO group peptidase (beta-lactamase class C family)